MKCPYCKKEIDPAEIAREIGRHTSALKKHTSALNGTMPCHEGKRRGRPLKNNKPETIK